MQTDHLKNSNTTLAVHCRDPTQMAAANFRTFQHYKSQKITTYSSTVYGLLTLTHDSKKLRNVNQNS